MKALSSSKTFLCPHSLCLLARTLPAPLFNLETETFVGVSHFSTSSSSSSSYHSFPSPSPPSYSSPRRHSEDTRNVRISVWWDFENCSIPCDANVFKVTQSITAAVRENGIKGPIQITAFGDVLQLSRANQEALSSTGITLTHIPHGGKNSADRSLLVDLLYWVSQNPPPAHLFLISSDRDFASTLHRLRMNNYNILLASTDNAPAVLCSAASIMWPWNALVKGENLSGKHFNQPPDGPFASWYGHYRVPLEDPFAVSNPTSCLQVEEMSDSNSDTKLRPVPKAVVNVIRNILKSHPKGLSITDLRSELGKSNVNIDKDWYGFKKFSRFLLAMPHVLKLQSEKDGQFYVRGITPKILETHVPSADVAIGPGMSTNDSVSTCPGIGQRSRKTCVPTPDLAAALSPSTEDSVSLISGIGPKGCETCVPGEDMSQDMVTGPNTSTEDSVFVISSEANGSPSSTVALKLQRPCADSEAPLENREESVQVTEHPPLVDKARDAEVSFNQVRPMVVRRPIPELMIFKRIWRKWFSDNYGSQEKIYDATDKSSSSQDITETVKADVKCVRSTGRLFDPGNVENSSEAPGGLFYWIKRWYNFWRSDEKSDNLNEESCKSYEEISRLSEMQEMHPESFWINMLAFLETPKGSEAILQSKTREELVRNLQQLGPPTLQSLSTRHVLHLVDLLISEKRWVEERPSQTFPFRLIGPAGKSFCSKPFDSKELIKETKGSAEVESNSQGQDHRSENRCQNVTDVGASTLSINKKPSPKIRSQILGDCQKLVNEVVNQYPDGFDISSFKKLFLHRYGYHLEVQPLGYQKLATLLKIMPGVKLESNYILPSGDMLNGSHPENSGPKVEEYPKSKVSRKEDGRDSPWDELGPITQINPNKDDNRESSYKTIEDEGHIDHDFETLPDNDFSDSEGERSTELERQVKCGIEDSSLLQILDSWYSNKEDSNRRMSSECFDMKVDYSDNGSEQSCLSGEALKNDTTVITCERKQKPVKSYTFVAENPENEKEKVINGILGSLKKLDDGLQKSKVEV